MDCCRLLGAANIVYTGEQPRINSFLFATPYVKKTGSDDWGDAFGKYLFAAFTRHDGRISPAYRWELKVPREKVPELRDISLRHYGELANKVSEEAIVRLTPPSLREVVSANIAVAYTRKNGHLIVMLGKQDVDLAAIVKARRAALKGNTKL